MIRKKLSTYHWHWKATFLIAVAIKNLSLQLLLFPFFLLHTPLGIRSENLILQQANWILKFDKLNPPIFGCLQAISPHLLPGSIVNQCILQKRAEHKENTNSRPNINGLSVSNRRKWVLNACLGGGHGQQCCYTQCNSCWNLNNNTLNWRLMNSTTLST